MADAPSDTAVILPQDVRDFANLPSEVPNDLLVRHIDIASRDLMRRTGIARPADTLRPELVADWRDALTALALASVFPWLNSFALSGAAKVGRLEGSVEYRFLDPDDVDAVIERLEALASGLIARITADQADDDDGDGSGSGVNAGGIAMAAV